MGLHTSVMSDRESAHHAAYALSMDAQSRADGVLEAVEAALAEAAERDWPEVRLALRHAQICHAQRWARDTLPNLVAQVEREALDAGLPAAQALTICHRALPALDAGDTSTFLDDMAEAAALLSTTGSYPINRLAGLISLGNTFDQARLWELADRAYVDAQAVLEGLDDTDAAASVLAQNRAEVRLTQVLTLAEMGDVAQATASLEGGRALLTMALSPTAPNGWRGRVEGLRLVAEVLCGLNDHLDVLATSALYDNLVADGEHEIALLVHLVLPAPLWTTTPDPADAQHGPHATLAWLLFARALEASDADPADVVAAYRHHGQLIARRAWESRRAVVSGVDASIDARLLEADRLSLASQVVTDELTGLGNRRAFEAAMTARAGQPITLLLIDLNDFKDVNDIFGHVVGDAVLKRCATLVNSVTDSRAVIARIGGDEFAVILDGAHPTEADHLCRTMARTIRDADWHDLTPGCSPSAAVGTAVGPADIDLVHEADLAMYDGKRRRDRAGRRRSA